MMKIARTVGLVHAVTKLLRLEFVCHHINLILASGSTD